MLNQFKLVLGLVWVFLFAISLNATAQQTPFNSINEKLKASAVEPVLLWPLEMEGFKLGEGKMDIKYSFPFQEANSNLTFNFADFEKLESSVFDLQEVSRTDLVEGYLSGIPKEYTEDFSKLSSSDFCMMFSKTENNQVKEVFMLVGNQTDAELLHFIYPANATTIHQNLKIELNNILN